MSVPRAAKLLSPRRRVLLALLLGVSAVVAAPLLSNRSTAQSTRPILISEPASTRAIAVESITRQREPFSPTTEVRWGDDARTRIMLFAMGVDPNASLDEISVTFEDGSHRLHTLVVEHLGAVPQQEWITSVIVRLTDELADVGDVLAGINFRGVASNRVRVAFGHVGGGPPDDPGSVPTPATLAPPSPSPAAAPAGDLTTSEVERIIAQAVSAASALSRAVTVAVTDKEGNVLGVFSMTGAPATTQLRGGGPGPTLTPNPLTGFVATGLDGTIAPATLAAISKAGTAALFSTRGNAFTTRTASFIIQEHFPPGVDFRPSGPLYGVQFSSLPCSDIKIPGLPLGLSGDPGSAPIYRNGEAVGGVGIEGDGVYTIDRDPADFDQPFEEIIAVSATRGFEAPSTIRGDNILVDGIRLTYLNVNNAPSPATIPFGSLPGVLTSPILGAQPSQFTAVVVGGIAGEVDTRFFPFIGSPTVTPNSLTASDVNTIISHAAQQANITRAAIRQPLGSNARVTIAVTDANGVVLGVFRQQDAPVFGFDVSVQKARTAAFYSSASAGALLRAAGFGTYVDRAAADGLRLDGSIAFTDRAGGFLHRPFFPDGINDTAAGPFSTELNNWSVFNVGLQLDLLKTNLQTVLGGGAAPCTSIPNLPNGLQIFAGSIPLYKNGELVGAIGISGDGIDQDDLIAAAGAAGYAPPVAIRSDQFFVREVRLPFIKLPRSPNL